MNNCTTAIHFAAWYFTAVGAFGGIVVGWIVGDLKASKRWRTRFDEFYGNTHRVNR